VKNWKLVAKLRGETVNNLTVPQISHCLPPSDEDMAEETLWDHEFTEDGRPAVDRYVFRKDHDRFPAKSIYNVNDDIADSLLTPLMAEFEEKIKKCAQGLPLKNSPSFNCAMKHLETLKKELREYREACAQLIAGIEALNPAGGAQSDNNER
jgi:hypothetical protein